MDRFLVVCSVWCLGLVMFFLVCCGVLLRAWLVSLYFLSCHFGGSSLEYI